MNPETRWSKAGFNFSENIGALKAGGYTMMKEGRGIDSYMDVRGALPDGKVVLLRSRNGYWSIWHKEMKA